jgi:hypothetical protein
MMNEYRMPLCATEGENLIVSEAGGDPGEKDAFNSESSRLSSSAPEEKDGIVAILAESKRM